MPLTTIRLSATTRGRAATLDVAAALPLDAVPSRLCGLDVAQECINSADKQEVAQHIERAASKARVASETNEDSGKPGSGLVRRPRSGKLVAGASRLSGSSPIMIVRRMLSLQRLMSVFRCYITVAWHGRHGAPIRRGLWPQGVQILVSEPFLLTLMT